MSVIIHQSMGNYVGPNGFGVSTTAEDIIKKQKIDVSGQTVVITGSNAGIGKETARVLAKYGAHVIMACRDHKKMLEVKDNIVKETPNAMVTTMDLDLGDISKIHKFVTEFKKLNIVIDVLINNAGVMPSSERWTTPDGFEYAVGINTYGTHLFTLLMLPFINKNSGRLVIVTSSAHFIQDFLDLDDWHSTKKYQFMNTYSKSKLGGLMLFLALIRRLREKKSKINCICVQPGVILSDLGRESFYLMKLAWTLAGPYFMKDLAQGAATTIYGGFSSDLEDQCGCYLEDSNFEDLSLLAMDQEEQEKLWKFAQAELKVNFDEIIKSGMNF